VTNYCRAISRVVLALSLSFCAGQVHARLGQDYFRASVGVVSQSQAERKRAAKEALSQVLVRISGSLNVLDDEALVAKLDGALNFVEQFQYRVPDGDDLLALETTELLSFTFSPIMVRNVLTETGHPFWQVSRPTTLVWLVEDNVAEGRQLHNQQSPFPLISGLTEAAQKRGLPLLFPLLDLEDQLSVSVDDVWNLNELIIAKASERYKTDVILVGRFSQTSRGELWTTWQYFHAGNTRVYDNRTAVDDDNAFATVGNIAIDPLADFLAARYAILPQFEAEAKLVVQLTGVENYQDYYRALTYLKGLAAVASVDLAAVRQETLLLYLDSDASIDRLIGILALDGKFLPVAGKPLEGPAWQQSALGSADNPMKFFWSKE
jgi:hypothetical protein